MLPDPTPNPGYNPSSDSGCIHPTTAMNPAGVNWQGMSFPAVGPFRAELSGLVCPDCGTPLVPSGGCRACPICGLSSCGG